MFQDPERYSVIDPNDLEVVYTFPEHPNYVVLDHKQIVAMGGKESEDLIFKFTLNLHNTEPLLARMNAEKLHYPTY